MTELTILAALALGFFGSTHCLGMCGGISAALTSRVQPGASVTGRAILYNLGRISSYTVAGLIVGTVGLWIGAGLNLVGLGLGLRFALGLLMVAIGLHLLVDWRGLRHIETLGAGFWRRLAPLARRFMPARTPGHALALGALWGWLPCGLVYSVLLAAAVSGSPLQGGLIMLAFGVGTLPAMIAVGAASGRLAKIPRQRLRRFAGAAILAYGAWTVASPILHLTLHDHDHHHHGQSHEHSHDYSSMTH